ncbi:MAG: putative Ig domain-containing protein [Pseudomonadota bacterium]
MNKRIFIAFLMLLAFSFSSAFAATMNVPSKLMVSAMDSKTDGVLMADGIWNLNKSGYVSNGYNLVAHKKYYFDINAYGAPVADKFAYVKVSMNDGILRKFNVAAAPLALYRVEYTPTVTGVAVLKIQTSVDAVGRNLYLESVTASAYSPDIVPPHIRFNASSGAIVASTTPAEFKFTLFDSESGVDASATQCILDGVVVTGCTSPKTYSGLSVGSHTFVLKAFDKAKNTASIRPYSFQVQAAVDAELGAFSISSIKALSTSSLQVAFGSSTNATSYSVKYGTAPGVYTATVANVTSPVTLSGLASGQKYYVLVVANNGASSKNANSEVSASTSSSTEPGTFTISSISALSGSTLQVEFGTSAKAMSYILKYGTVPGVYSTLVSDNAISPATIPGLVSGQTYYIKVTAVSNDGSSDVSVTGSGKTLSATSNPSLGQGYYDMEIIAPRVGNAKDKIAGLLDTKNRFYKAYPGLLYEVRAAVLGGAYPFKHVLKTAPAGMKIDAETGVISWPAPVVAETQPAYPVTLSVTDQNNVTKEVSWTIKVTTDKFLFVDAVNGKKGASGTLSDPMQSFLDVYGSSKGDDSHKDYFVYFKNGTYYPEGYTGGGRMVQLTPWKPMVWMAYPGHKPLMNISTSSFDCKDGIFNNLYVEGLEFTQVTAPADSDQRKAFWINSGSYDVVFRNNKFQGMGVSKDSWNQSQIFIAKGNSHGEYWAIQDNAFHDITHGYGILAYLAHKVVLEDNYFHKIFDGHPIGPKNGTSYWSIRHNEITGGENYGIWIYGDGEYYNDMEVSFNYVNVPPTGEHMEGALSVNGAQVTALSNIYVFRNTFVGDVVYYGALNSSAVNVVSNNVIINTAKNGYQYGYEKSEGNLAFFKDNLVGGPSSNMVDSEGSLTTAYRAYVGAKGWEIP